MFKAEIIGNLGADVEIKDGNGNKFASCRVAHSDVYVDENGTKHETTQWVDVIINNTDSKLLEYLVRGTKVFVRGNARVRVYSSAIQRKMVAGITIHAVEIELCGGSRDEVPSQLINPDTGAMFRVTKHFWCDRETSELKDDGFFNLVDTRGRLYMQNKQGFVVPAECEAQQAQSVEIQKVDSKQG